MSQQAPQGSPELPPSALSELRARMSAALEQILAASHDASSVTASSRLDHAQRLLGLLLKTALPTETRENLKAQLNEEGSPLHAASQVLTDTSQALQRAVQRYLSERNLPHEGSDTLNGTFLLEHGAHLLKGAATLLGAGAAQALGSLYHYAQQANAQSERPLEFDLPSLLRTLFVRMPHSSPEVKATSKTGGAR